MLREGQCAIGRNRINIIRVENRNAFGLHFGRKFGAVFYEKLSVDLMVFHNNSDFYFE